jgi:hypothetical protein
MWWFTRMVNNNKQKESDFYKDKAGEPKWFAGPFLLRCVSFCFY